MRKGFRLVLWGVFVLIMVLTVSCSPSPAGPAVGAEPAEPDIEEPSAEVAEAGEEVSGGEELEAPVDEAGVGGEQPVTDRGIQADIPVPEEAYKVQVSRQGRIVNFQIDGTIDEVVAFYTENLPAFGWESAGPPDTSVGSIATMLRKNEAGDQLSINMQSNEIGGFVLVTVSVARSG